jgi:glycosyltransferase involved in cell wall biosynthesis
MTRRIFVICMFDSIHSARWLGQFREEDIEFLLFPSSPHRRVHKDLKHLLSGQSTAKYRLVPLGRWFGLPLWVLDKFVDNLSRGLLARRFIAKFGPEIVHALELQNAGYVALKAIEGNKPHSLKLMTTNYGSDIFWFQRFPKHKQKLERLMALSDYSSAECSRDLKLATQLGFQGTFLPVIPNAGGFSTEVLSRKLAPSRDRKDIAIKGYHGWVGRAKIALDAIETMANELSDYQLVIYSANQTTKRRAKELVRKTGLKIKVNGKGALSHSQVLDLFSKSKIYIGLSESDGISTSLLEAMAMGAIPVQTATACCDEWFSDTGVAVKEITSEAVQVAIRKALVLAEDQANADHNRETIREKASAEKVSAIAKTFYSI